MNNSKFDQFRDKMIRHIRQTLKYCESVSKEEFDHNQMLQEACILNVLQVGELAAKVIEYELDKEHPDIEWRQMRGMRNRLVHDYDGVRMDMVWDVIKNDFPAVLNKLEWLS